MGNSSFLQWDPPLNNRTATGCCHGPCPVLGASQVKIPLTSMRSDCGEEGQPVCQTGWLEAESHSGPLCGSTQSQMQSLISKSLSSFGASSVFQCVTQRKTCFSSFTSVLAMVRVSVCVLGVRYQELQSQPNGGGRKIKAISTSDLPFRIS